MNLAIFLNEYIVCFSNLHTLKTISSQVIPNLLSNTLIHDPDMFQK